MLKNYLLDFWYQDFALMVCLTWLILLLIFWSVPKNKIWKYALPALLLLVGGYASVKYSQDRVNIDERKQFTQKCQLEGESVYESTPEVLGILLDDEAKLLFSKNFRGWFAQDKHTGEFESADTQPYDKPIHVISEGIIGRLKNTHGYVYVDYRSQDGRGYWKAIEQWRLDRLLKLTAVNERSQYRVWVQLLKDEDLQDTGIQHYHISIINQQSQALVAEKHIYTFEEQFKPKEETNSNREQPISCQLKPASQLSEQIRFFIFKVLPPKQIIGDQLFTQQLEKIEAAKKKQKGG